ncbi:hypothetical protein KOI35_12690 [Actinoplanes bogorensis]|uniref:DUF6545 domain-containing protein n=1 Tax=Paractinoplanes bogorensis TaxID=1610840 RepID=A0ABS5YNQ7_9ACTN|nr:MAB_1171c family putative transporter [Actinoplanes bogorensis]MBU2664353.1 hypothetical protein [Actinoplanes bogorensis]
MVILAAALMIFLWGLAVSRLPGLWRDSRQRALSASIIALAVSRTAGFPPLVDELSRAHLGAAQHLAAMVASYWFLRFVLLADGRAAAWHRASAAVMLTLLATAAVTFAVSPGVVDGPLTPGVVTFWLALDLYVGTALSAGAVLFGRTAAGVPARWSRAALRGVAAGAGLLALDTLFRAVVTTMIGAGAGVDPARLTPPAEFAQAVGALLMVAGGAAVSVPRGLSALAAYRSLLALRPLWKAMRDTFPQVILFSPRRAIVELAGVDDVHLRVYRRVIEIRDGLLALRVHLPPGPAAGDSGATRPRPGIEPGTADQNGPEDEARRIAEALHRRARGDEPVGEPGSWATVGPEMTDEVAWLSAVSTAYRKISEQPVSCPPAAPTPRPSGSSR